MRHRAGSLRDRTGKGLETEVAEALDGRVVRVFRRGSYADVRTPNVLVECKWSTRGVLRISGRYCSKVMALARLWGLYPLLVSGYDDVRALCLLGGGLPEGVDKDVIRLLYFWRDRGYVVFVIPLDEGAVDRLRDLGIMSEKVEVRRISGFRVVWHASGGNQG